MDVTIKVFLQLFGNGVIERDVIAGDSKELSEREENCIGLNKAYRLPQILDF